MSTAPSGSPIPLRSRDELAESACQRHAARVDADERDGLEVVVPLDDLVRDPCERP